jgi:Bacteriocin-protection, YdeI or OmpD-Associated/Domain of unknown function (DUF1905)
MAQINLSPPLIDDQFLVQKFEAKGGWTYVVITGLPATLRDKLGQIRVCGTIDNYELKQFNMLPMKGGDMLLPLNSKVRKKTGKSEGDTVHVILFADDSPIVIPEEIELCLLESPQAHAFFLTLSPSNQKHYIDWIEEAKLMETKDTRIVKMLERLEKGRKFYDW